MLLALLEPARLRQVGQWFILGVAAVGVEIGELALLYQVLGVSLPLASAVAAESLVLARFVATDRWVFGHRRPALGRCVRYHGASAGAFVVSWAVLNASAALLGVPYVLATLLGTGASFGWSLLAHFFWVWRPAPSLAE